MVRIALASFCSKAIIESSLRLVSASSRGIRPLYVANSGNSESTGIGIILTVPDVEIPRSVAEWDTARYGASRPGTRTAFLDQANCATLR